jgi:large subunit ribosomal protein L17
MAYRKLGRTSAQRKAMLRDLTTDLIINERIETTETRAKELRSTVEKMITLGKRGDLHARRQASSYVRNEVANAENGQDAVQKLVNIPGPVSGDGSRPSFDLIGLVGRLRGSRK